MRPAQDLDPLEVERRDVDNLDHAVRIGDRHVLEVQAGRRLHRAAACRAARRADAADRDGVVRRIALGDLHAGGQLERVLLVARAARLEVAALDHRDGSGDLALLFGALVGGDDDGLERLRFARRGGVLGRDGRRCADPGGRRQHEDERARRCQHRWQRRPQRKGWAAPRCASWACCGNRAFWIVALGAGLYGFGLGALQFSLVPMLMSRGVALTQAAAAQSLISVGLFVGNLLAGVLLDRVNAARFASAVMLAPVLAVGLLALSDSASVGLAASGLLGMAVGGEASVLVYLVSRLFAPAIYGRAYALQTVVLAVLAGLGPLLGGWAFDRDGNYTLILQASAAAFVLAAIAPLGLRRSDHTGHHHSS